MEGKLGKDHPDVATCLNNLAMLYLSQEQYAKAEPLLQRSLAVSEARLGKDHPDLSLSLINMGELYWKLGHYAKAESLLKRCLTIQEAKLGKDQLQVADTLDHLGAVYNYQGRFDEALPLFRRGIAIVEAKLGKDHFKVANIVNNLAWLYQAQGQYAKAEPLFKRSLAIRETQLGKYHPYGFVTLSNLVVSTAAQQKWSKAAEWEERLLRGCQRHLSLTLLGLAEQEQLHYLDRNFTHYFQKGLSVGWKNQDADVLPELSASWLLNGKGLAQEALAQRSLLARSSNAPALTVPTRQLINVRRLLSAQAQRLPEEGNETSYQQRLRDLGEQEEYLSHQLGLRVALAASSSDWIKLSDLRQAIPVNAVVIDIARFHVDNFDNKGLDREKLPARYAAWVVPPGEKEAVHLIDLGPADVIDQTVERLRRSLGKAARTIYDEGEASAEALFKKDLQAVADLVLKPLLPHTGKAQRWYLSPDASLWLVPWSALPLADGRYVVEQHQISYLSTGRDLLVQPPLVEPGPSLVVADPDFDLDPTRLKTLSGTEYAQRGPSRLPGDRVPEDWARLPGTAAELQALLPRLTTYLKTPPVQLTGAGALEGRLKEQKRPRVLVLATHGYFLQDQERSSEQSTLPLMEIKPSGKVQENPFLRCGLVLAGANRRNRIDDKKPVDDGLLTGLEVLELDLRGTELVVLSACDTGVGTIRNGEGVAGLRQAFQLAGAQSVLASLWKVPDAETADLMTRFWDHMARHTGRANALREAQLGIIQQRRAGKTKAAHPYFWAAFTLTGLDEAAALKNRAWAYIYQGKLDLALADCNQAVRLDPADAQAYRFRASAQLRKGKYSEAVKDSTEAIRLDPSLAVAYNERGAAYSYLDKYDEAIADYTQALKLNGDDALFYRNRGSCWFYKGDYDQAIKDLNTAIKLNPKDAKAYWRRGQAHDKKNLTDEAKTDYAEAIRLDPSLAKKK